MATRASKGRSDALQPGGTRWGSTAPGVLQQRPRIAPCAQCGSRGYHRERPANPISLSGWRKRQRRDLRRWAQTWSPRRHERFMACGAPWLPPSLVIGVLRSAATALYGGGGAQGTCSGCWTVWSRLSRPASPTRWQCKQGVQSGWCCRRLEKDSATRGLEASRCLPTRGRPVDPARTKTRSR
jgi:hypothetical protein